jgi:hypothetical protein
MKRRPRSHTADRLPFTASVLPFEFVAPLPLAACITRLKKMTVTEPPSDIAFFRIDADLQRFYLKTRAFRSPLIEAQGMLRRTGDEQTVVSGDVFGDVLFTPLIIVFVIGLMLLVLITFNIWALLFGLIALGFLLIYWRRMADQTAADKARLAQLIQEAVTPISDAAEPDITEP